MDKNGKILRKIEITKSGSRSNRKYEQSLKIFPKTIHQDQTVLLVISSKHLSDHSIRRTHTSQLSIISNNKN